jgi:agmatinase
MTDKTFDPEGTFSKDSSIFGMPKNENAALHLIPLAWEPTTSFKKGTVDGPEALFEATKQMDLYHPYFRKSYEKGIYWKAENLEASKNLNAKAVKSASAVVDALENEKPVTAADLESVNDLSKGFNKMVYDSALDSLNKGKTVGLVGGDHSCPFGLIKALSEKHTEGFSIVHIDAHFDFRDAYQGFEHSHASIMHNVRTKLSNPPTIFQLGIRDFCESELKFASEHSTYILDQELHAELLKGKSFEAVMTELFKNLSEKIYISFDIDGLSPEHCPNTGTPVPGGLSYNQAVFMIQMLHAKGHKLIGFDLVEVSPGKSEVPGEGLDEVVGSRLLYELSCYALASSV